MESMTEKKQELKENFKEIGSFEELFSKQNQKDEKLVGTVIKGIVLNIEKETNTGV